MLYWFWELAEQANWKGWFPKKFWLSALHRCDRYYGYGKEQKSIL